MKGFTAGLTFILHQREKSVVFLVAVSLPLGFSYVVGDGEALLQVGPLLFQIETITDGEIREGKWAW